MNKRRFTPAQELEIIKETENGVTIREVAELRSVAESTIKDIRKRHKLPSRVNKEIRSCYFIGCPKRGYGKDCYCTSHKKQIKRGREPSPVAVTKRLFLSRKESEYAGHMRRKFGLTIGNIHDMHDRQNGKCPYCDVSLEKPYATPEVPGLKPSVHHDHDTGKIESLLCFSCNKALHQGLIRAQTAEAAWSEMTGEEKTAWRCQFAEEENRRVEALKTTDMLTSVG